MSPYDSDEGFFQISSLGCTAESFLHPQSGRDAWTHYLRTYDRDRRHIPFIATTRNRVMDEPLACEQRQGGSYTSFVEAISSSTRRKIVVKQHRPKTRNSCDVSISNMTKRTHGVVSRFCVASRADSGSRLGPIRLASATPRPTRKEASPPASAPPKHTNISLQHSAPCSIALHPLYYVPSSPSRSIASSFRVQEPTETTIWLPQRLFTPRSGTARLRTRWCSSMSTRPSPRRGRCDHVPRSS
jgi:hypothetical protein